MGRAPSSQGRCCRLSSRGLDSLNGALNLEPLSKDFVRRDFFRFETLRSVPLIFQLWNDSRDQWSSGSSCSKQLLSLLGPWMLLELQGSVYTCHEEQDKRCGKRERGLKPDGCNSSGGRVLLAVVTWGHL